VVVYIPVAGTLLLRLGPGLLMSRRLLRSSRSTALRSEGIEVRESDRIAAPVTLGSFTPQSCFPVDWRDWECTKLDAVLAHGRSHIRRYDPAVDRKIENIRRAVEEGLNDASWANTPLRALHTQKGSRWWRPPERQVCLEPLDVSISCLLPEAIMNGLVAGACDERRVDILPFRLKLSDIAA
jgi:hypothetical protein